MSDILIHLTISGLIVLQSITGSPNHWRVVVPDFSESHHPHVAFLLVETAAIRPAVTAPEKYTIFPLENREMTLTGMTAVGTSHFPADLLTYQEAAGVNTGDETKLRLREDFVPKPALELFLDEAGLETTWIRTGTPWYFERTRNGQTVRTTERPIAEEVCLQFSTAAKTLKLFEGTDHEIELAPGQGRIEIRLGNIVPGDTSDPSIDPHFHMYYDLTKKMTAFEDQAELKTDAAPGSAPAISHDHTMSTVEIDPGQLRMGWPVTASSGFSKIRRREAQASGQGVHAVTGANCPPIGSGGYP